MGINVNKKTILNLLFVHVREHLRDLGVVHTELHGVYLSQLCPEDLSEYCAFEKRRRKEKENN